MSTPLLIKPTIEEVLLQGAKIGLPEVECYKFFHHYTSNGWKVGKVPMVSFPSALAGWNIRWQEREAQRNGNGNGNVQRGPNGADTMLKSKEYDRVVERMKLISDGYAQHQTWDETDKSEWYKLKVRRNELRQELGIMI